MGLAKNGSVSSGAREHPRVAAVGRLALIAACGSMLCYAAYLILWPGVADRLDPYAGRAIGAIAVSADGRWAALLYGSRTTSGKTPQRVLVVDLAEGKTSWSSPDPGDGRDWEILGWAHDGSLLLANTARSLTGEASVTGEDPLALRLVLYATDVYRVRHSGASWDSRHITIPGRSRYSPYPDSGCVVNGGRSIVWAEFAWPLDIAAATKLAQAQEPPHYDSLFGPQSFRFYKYTIGAQRSELLTTVDGCEFTFALKSRFCIKCWYHRKHAADAVETRLFDAQTDHWTTLGSPEGEGWGIPSVSPDGRLAAWQRPVPEAVSGFELVLSQVVNSNESIVWRSVVPHRLILKWSHDGRYLLGAHPSFWSEAQKEQPVLVDLAEQSVRRLPVPHMGWVTTAAWLPDSSSILMAGRRKLWRMDLPSGAWHWVWSVDE